MNIALEWTTRHSQFVRMGEASCGHERGRQMRARIDTVDFTLEWLTKLIWEMLGGFWDVGQQWHHTASANRAYFKNKSRGLS